MFVLCKTFKIAVYCTRIIISISQCRTPEDLSHIMDLQKLSKVKAILKTSELAMLKSQIVTTMYNGKNDI